MPVDPAARYGDGLHSLIADGPTVTAEPAVTVDHTDIESALAATLASNASTSFPIADRDTDWKAADAEADVRKWAGVDADEPTAAAWKKYGTGHFWQASADASKLGDFKLPFIDIVDGKPTAIPKGVFGAAAALQGSRGGVDIPDGDVAGVKAKVEKYYEAMSEQFDDKTIEVPWADDDKSAAALAAAAKAHPLSSLCPEERRKVDAANEITDPDALGALVAAAVDARGGVPALLAKRGEAGLTASVGPDGTVTPAAWHCHAVIEGIRTGDHREFLYGSVQLPDLPVSLRLLIEDEGGHWGAVTCGRVDTITPVDITEGVSRFYDAAGMFGSDPNGQLAELMVTEQTQRFVSVDPRDDVTAQWVEVLGGTAIVVDGIEIPVGGDDDYDCWWQFTNYPLGGMTIVPIPAFPQCAITLASVALPDAPAAMEAAPASLPPGAIVITVDDDDADEDDWVETPANMAASAATLDAPSEVAGPPAVFFDDPGFHMGDDRLVLQSDGESYACPLTIGDPDPDTGFRRIFGHFAWWNCDHTGFPGQQIKPPHSTSGYAYFNLGQGVDCAAGTRVSGVGRVTMGTGHAPLSKIDNGKARNLSVAEVQAHYDGGYGALTAAYVKAGEDEFGPWVAGYVNPQLSASELRDLMTLNLSGDWRDIADNLEALAVLAVPVPGFPICRQMTASGAPEVRDFDTRASFTGDRPVALVAAGIVRRVSPEARLVRLEMDGRQDRAEIDSLKALVASMRREQYGI